MQSIEVAETVKSCTLKWVSGNPRVLIASTIYRQIYHETRHIIPFLKHSQYVWGMSRLITLRGFCTSKNDNYLNVNRNCSIAVKSIELLHEPKPELSNQLCFWTNSRSLSKREDVVVVWYPQLGLTISCSVFNSLIWLATKECIQKLFLPDHISFTLIQLCTFYFLNFPSYLISHVLNLQRLIIDLWTQYIVRLSYRQYDTAWLFAHFWLSTWTSLKKNDERTVLFNTSHIHFSAPDAEVM